LTKHVRVNLRQSDNEKSRAVEQTNGIVRHAHGETDARRPSYRSFLMIGCLAHASQRPGGNVTGMAQSVEGLTGKLVEVALEIIPGARRIGFLSNPKGASMRLFAQSVDVAARARGMAVLTEEAAAGEELASAFDRFGSDRGSRCRRGARFRFRSIREARGAGRHRAGERSVLFAGTVSPATTACPPCVTFTC
jgi:hypothetical protein